MYISENEMRLIFFVFSIITRLNFKQRVWKGQVWKIQVDSAFSLLLMFHTSRF